MVSTGLSKSLSLGSNPSGATMLERIKLYLEEGLNNPYTLIGTCFTELELETFSDRELDIILKLAIHAYECRNLYE